MKICIKCNKSKEDELFMKGRNACKDCISEYKKEHRKKNSDKIKSYMSNYYINNKEIILDRLKENYSNNKEKKLEYQKVYSINNKEKIKEYKSNHAKKNKEKIKNYKNNYQNNKRKNDPICKLKYSLSRCIRNALKNKGLPKNNKTIDILGCDIIFFKEYIESLFTLEMSWDNYGQVWDLDHIKPLSTANTEELVYELNHYTNLQPLNCYINRHVKKDKTDFDIQNYLSSTNK